MEQLFLGGVENVWPNPQLMVGANKIWFLGKNNIHLVDPYTFELYSFDIKSGYSGTTEAEIPTGTGPWQIADMQESWLMTNGRCTVLWFLHKAIQGDTDYVRMFSNPTCEAAAFYKGRVVLGGFNVRDYRSAAWDGFWQDQESLYSGGSGYTASRDLYDGDGQKRMPVGSNFLWYSQVGGGDILMQFEQSIANETINPDNAGGYDEDTPFVMDTLLRNDSGWVPVPIIGYVRQLKQLGDYLICYTDNGVWAYRHVSSPVSMLAPVAIPALSMVGIANKGAANGNLERHLFVDRRGSLWVINKDLSVECLGFEEFIYPLTQDQGGVIVSFVQNPQLLNPYGEFHISDSEESYVLTEQGLGGPMAQAISSACYYGGGLIALGTEITNDSDVEAIYESEIFDFDRAGIKSIRNVGVRATDDQTSLNRTNIQVRIAYRFSGSEQFSYTPYKPVNKEGWVYFPVGGIEFKLVVKTLNIHRTTFSGIEFEYQLDDSRYRRSISVNGT